jgi:hypothetical protein
LPHVQAYTASPVEAETVLQQLQQTMEHAPDPPARSKRPQQTVRVIVADDILQSYADSTSEGARQILVTLLRQHSGHALYMLMAGTLADLIAKGWGEPVKLLKDAPIGILLGSQDDTFFDLRLALHERNRPLSLGEGYLIVRNRGRRFKAAWPDL